MEEALKLRIVEPHWNDCQVELITKKSEIKDEALAFIYGAIKKYGCDTRYNEDLKRYILQ